MQIDSNKPHYPCNTIADMARIPAEARPRFLAELPVLLESIRQVQEAADAMAERALWPWPLSLLPESFRRRTVARSLARFHTSSITWVDDDKGLLNVRVQSGAQTVFDETRKMNGERA